MSKVPDFTPVDADRHSEANWTDRSKPNLAPRKLVRMLIESSLPMYLLDSRNRVRFASQPLAEALNCSIDQLIGLDCQGPLPSDSNVSPIRAGLLSIPAITAKGMIHCFPLPSDLQDNQSATLAHSKWIAVLVIPLDQQHKNGLRWCVWIDDPTGLRDAAFGTIHWYDQTSLRSAIHEARSQWTKLDHLMPLIGRSHLARRLMNQVQAAISNNRNCLILGPSGSEKGEIARAIFEHRRLVSGRTLAEVRLVPIECRLMDPPLLTETLDLVCPTSVLSKNRLSSAASSSRDIQVELLLHGIDLLPVSARGNLASFLLRNPQISVIATASSPNQIHRVELTTESTNASQAKSSIPDDASLYQDSKKDQEEFSSIMASVAVMVIDVPALRDRIEDIPPLCELLLEQERTKSESKIPRSISPALRQSLQAYSWPGNYRELRTAMADAYANSSQSQIEAHHLPLGIRTFASHDLRPVPVEPLNLDLELEDYERKILTSALAAHGNNRAAAARSLSITRSRLLRRLEQLDVSIAMHEPSMVQETPDTEATIKDQTHPDTTLPTITTLPVTTIDDDRDSESPIFEAID